MALYLSDVYVWSRSLDCIGFGECVLHHPVCFLGVWGMFGVCVWGGGGGSITPFDVDMLSLLVTFSLLEVLGDLWPIHSASSGTLS